MSQETTATYAAMLKEWYTGDRVEDMVYKTNPALALIAKSTDFEGKNLPIPIIYGTTQGGSADFATAVANKGSSQTKEFLLTRVSDYALASIGREVMKASKSDKGAFMQAAKTNTDGAIRTATRSLATALFRSGSGAIGQISAASNVGTATITLSDINDIANFENSMVLQLSATNGTGAVRTGTVTITGLDRQLGTITLGGNWTAGIAAAAASDFIFRSGDYAKKLSGFAGWIPKVAPVVGGGDSWYGVDRAADTRLSGIRHDGTSQSIEESLMDLQSKIAREGGAPSHCFVNNAQYRQLLKSLSSKVHYTPTRVEANARISFSGIEIMGDAGPISIIPDYNCPSTVAWMLQLDVCKLHSLDKAPHIFDQDTDQEMLRESGTDGYELRVGYYANLGIRAPGWCGRAELAAAT